MTSPATHTTTCFAVWHPSLGYLSFGSRSQVTASPTPIVAGLYSLRRYAEQRTRERFWRGRCRYEGGVAVVRVVEVQTIVKGGPYG